MLIAEIGNCHFGSFDRAKEMIRVAHDCGADLIKAQAFRAKDIKSGSMPHKFYESCAFSVDKYLELIDYARKIGNDLFYSIFSPGMSAIAKKQNWHKIAGAQTRDGQAKMKRDSETLIVSVPMGVTIPKFKKAEVLYVCDYMTANPMLEHIETLHDYLDRPVGYSDHTLGITHAIRARRFHGAQIIEKHFCLVKNEKWAGQIFRDTVHGATPREFETLAKELSR